MKKTSCYAALLFILFCWQCQAQTSRVKRRSESFFGVHFDFHAQPNDRDIGRTLTLDMIDRFLDEVKPDYIQVDTKGHPGIASYPTRIGISAPTIVQDPLKLFRRATLSRGVGLYSHFSGLVDMAAVRNHPDWARINANGERDGSVTSLFSAYCDEYFIPQIEELSKTYGIDGVWIDGECWAVQPDFSAAAKKAFILATGKQPVMDNGYMAFTRKAYHSYLAHYTDVLHRFNPNFQVASNWAFSSYMPGKIDAKVDFLSGDIVNDDIRNVEFEARVMAGYRGIPWDLMVWGFMGDKNGQGHYWKSARMLQQKAAGIISQGGGFQVYINQNHDASIPPEVIPTLKMLSRYCKARKPYCFKTNAVPQVAVLLTESGHDYDLGNTVAFDQANGGNNNIKGTMCMLLDSHYSVNILQEYQLAEDLKKYPLLVITEWNYLAPGTIKKVEDYIYNGGNVLIIGSVSCRLFGKALPAQTQANSSNAAGLPVKINNFGKGKVIGIDANISLSYLNSSDDRIRDVVEGQVKQLFYKPLVTINGSKRVHVSISKSGQTTSLHLVNTGDRLVAVNNNELQFELSPANQLAVAFVSKAKPSEVTLQPGNVPVRFNYTNGKVTFIIPALDTYSIVKIR
jgi:hypothetical protein